MINDAPVAQHIIDDINQLVVDQSIPQGSGQMSSSNNNNHERYQPTRRKRKSQDNDRYQINDNKNHIGLESERLDMSAQLASSSALVATTTTPDSSPPPLTSSLFANSTEEALMCRLEKNFYLDFEQYKHYTCANCYK